MTCSFQHPITPNSSHTDQVLTLICDISLGTGSALLRSIFSVRDNKTHKSRNIRFDASVLNSHPDPRMTLMNVLVKQ